MPGLVERSSILIGVHSSTRQRWNDTVDACEQLVRIRRSIHVSLLSSEQRQPYFRRRRIGGESDFFLPRSAKPFLADQASRSHLIPPQRASAGSVVRDIYVRPRSGTFTDCRPDVRGAFPPLERCWSRGTHKNARERETHSFRTAVRFLDSISDRLI
jgi:hypothetical protein